MIGYLSGGSPLHRAHPYTPLALATAFLLLAFACTTPAPIWALVAAAFLMMVMSGKARALLAPTALLLAPPWIVLLVLRGVFDDPPTIALGPLVFSRPGLETALVLGGRLGAIVPAFLTALTVVSPARLVDAMTARGAPFGRVFLLVSTLTFIPRTRLRAVQILDAQQMRGLRLRGSPFARLKALGPLILPLVLGALAEVDEQVLALEARGATMRGRRTPLDPPADPPRERALRLALLMLVVAAWVMRL